MGGMASLLVLISVTPTPVSRGEQALIQAAMADIASFILLPSIALTLWARAVNGASLTVAVEPTRTEAPQESSIATATA